MSNMKNRSIIKTRHRHQARRAVLRVSLSVNKSFACEFLKFVIGVGCSVLWC